MTSVLIQGDRGLAVRRFRCAADGRRAQANIESDGIGATLVRRVCGWCQAEMGVVAGSPDQAGEITHGICPACAERMTNELPGAPRLSCAVGSATAGRDRPNLASGGGLEDGGEALWLGAPAVDAAPLAPSPSPAAPGADIVAAGGAQGHGVHQVNGPAGSVDAPARACSQQSDEHARAVPAAVSDNFAGGKPASAPAPGQAVRPLPAPLFWCVTGADFGRVIRWAKNHWRNPLDALVRGKINQIKETHK